MRYALSRAARGRASTPTRSTCAWASRSGSSGWKARGWRTASRKPVKNQDLWEQLDALVADHDLEWHWVKGHSGVPGNERCDQLANSAIDALLGLR